MRKLLITPYDRCKANRRCNWGVVELDQYTNDVRFFHQLFDQGNLYDIELFLDFEDWRMGSRGFSWDANLAPTQEGFTSTPRARAADGVIRGAHFWPFDQSSLGPDVPCFLTERNQGLILDRSLQYSQIYMQESLVADLQGRIAWLTENIETAAMGPVLRSRKDVRIYLSDQRADYSRWEQNEQEELNELRSSQCVSTGCHILFNTSSLRLSGAINGTGVIGNTSSGTEVALFTFNSIYLGPEVQVTVVGQRALALLSKTTAIINTTIEISPGTLGGFPGGGSVARYASDMLVDDPRYIYICDLGGYCSTNSSSNSSSSSRSGEPIISNNVNGPGSGNVRINPFIIRTGGSHIPEIQSVTTSAKAGQTLSGGFILHFKNYSTPLISHDASSLSVQRVIEDNLNLINPDSSTIFLDRDGRPAGVGFVSVTRSGADPQEGYTWNITFTSAIGNIEQIRATSWLWADGAETNIIVRTLRDGNELGGSFQLEFQGYKTKPILSSETAASLRKKLLALPVVTSAFVDRSDPTNNCDDGLCQNGPYPARGLLWVVYVTTDLTADDVTPTSPTSPLALETAPYYHFTADGSALTGQGANVEVLLGTSESPYIPQDLLNISFPFSLAFGGAGGSYGGSGGSGYGANAVGPTYSDRYVSDLVGGSGGCMAQTDPFLINAVLGRVSGIGGDGGGAIEIISASDLTIGSFGKIIAIGGDGEQSSQGGGGGGSGGAILLASGTAVKVDGNLDVSGGNGGYGGSYYQNQAGGGGGGGRIAIYADSIVTTSATISYAGGKCGVYSAETDHDALYLNGTAVFYSSIPLDPTRVKRVIKLHLQAIAPDSTTQIVHSVTPSEGFGQVVNATFSVVFLDPKNVSALLNTTEQLLVKQKRVNIAEFSFLGCSALQYELGTYTQVDKSQPSSCTNSGEAGSYYSEALMTTAMYVSATKGAEDTSRALFFSNNEMTNTSTGSLREVPFAWNGPTISFEPSRPTRVTYYTRTDSVPNESTRYGYGSLFSLVSRGESGLNVSNVIGVYFGWAIMHGSNFGSAVDESTFYKRLVTMDPSPTLATWYKVDIRIQWDAQTYSVALNDTIVTYNQTFQAEDIDGIRLSVWMAVEVWFDEIYVGFDNTMDFSCPITTRTGTRTDAPVQKGWSFEEVHGGNSNGYTEYKTMQRHYNFLLTTGSIPFDGQGAVSDFQDIKIQNAQGDYAWVQGKIHAGALVYLTNSARTIRSPLAASATLVSSDGLWYSGADKNIGDGRQFLYSEYTYTNTRYPSLNGGVAACSSQDLSDWRFEGIVFHYVNLSDMVYGYDNSTFYIERPKVLFNSLTNEYVMWAAMDRTQRDLAMNMIASSPFEDGPFLFRRSFYPDGNKTRDQVIYMGDGDLPQLARTYYQTVEYILPQAIMQPIWESAKSRTGLINYRSNYHRAYYHVSYDNYNDIYLQRWRKEDINYQVLCKNKITGVEREVASGTYNADGFICDDPSEVKIVIGQGNPNITSRFVSPNNSAYSWWRPTSVPAVLAQDWSANYQDGYCGIRKLNDNYAEDDPDLATFEPTDRSTCSNIADNPVHTTLADKLIGVLRVVLTRRAKYLAVSQLTGDYMDTNGYLSSFEGELESGNLISLLTEKGQFGLTAGSQINSTFRPPQRAEFETAWDYRIRFSQYIRNYNDRASYSLACVLDGVCPVNFADQLTSGQT
eukprot:scaffold3756_cov180-Ochromonas_danica.AAC.12